MNIVEYNRSAWNKQSSAGSEWCTPVNTATIARARSGDWRVILTPTRPVPRFWFGDLRGKHLLCLASGGGQQAPVLAAAGADVVSLDLSEEQLAKDRLVAERDNLPLHCVQGDMADLSAFEDEYFDLVFHPVSNLFIPEVSVVWAGCYRVLRPGGSLLAGFMNPDYFLFDHEEAQESGTLTVKYRVPYADVQGLEPKLFEKRLTDGGALEFSHSLEAQIGGQLEAGFVITGFYEDWWLDEATPLNRFAPTSMATRALKPPSNISLHPGTP